MELPWNICPYCGTPELGMRREGMSMDEVLRTLKTDEEKTEQENGEQKEESKE
jgi:hypothetical protein